jgi:hypothetical protein
LTKKGKRQPTKEKAPRIKRKNSYSKLRGAVAEGRGDVGIDVDE